MWWLSGPVALFSSPARVWFFIFSLKMRKVSGCWQQMWFSYTFCRSRAFSFFCTSDMYEKFNWKSFMSSYIRCVWWILLYVFYRFPTSDSCALWSRRWPPATIVWRVRIWSFDIVRLLVNNSLHAWTGWRRYGRTSGFIWRFERILVGHHASVFGKLRFCLYFYFMLLNEIFRSDNVSVNYTTLKTTEREIAVLGCELKTRKSN